jgi:hypothetical protein
VKTNNDAAQPTGEGEAPERIWIDNGSGIWEVTGARMFPDPPQNMRVAYVRADLIHPSTSGVSERAGRAVNRLREANMLLADPTDTELTQVADIITAEFRLEKSQ